MRRAIFVLEAINTLLTLITNMQNRDLLGFSVTTWNIIAFLVFVGGFVALFWSDKDLEMRIYDKVIADVSKNREIAHPQSGNVDSVTSQDRGLILQFARDMIMRHGHMDLDGLLADRASGVPLNELMTRNCSICSKPRNEKSGVSVWGK